MVAFFATWGRRAVGVGGWGRERERERGEREVLAEGCLQRLLVCSIETVRGWGQQRAAAAA